MSYQIWHALAQMLQAIFVELSTGFLQNKQPHNYKKYKIAARYSQDIDEYFQAFKFYWLYAVLKVKFVMKR